jgi:hypothetical protein
MKFPRINTSFTAVSDSNFETKGQSIYTSMLDNPNFLTPVPSLAAVLEAQNNYSLALTAAQKRDRDAVAVKNEARNVLEALLAQLANYVNATANGDKTKLVSSGFDLAADGGITNLGKPASIDLTDGKNAGELVVKIPVVKGAKSYGAQYTPDPLTAESVWTQTITTASKYTFTDLISGKKYWCRMAAVGPYEQIVYSDAVCRVAQ